MSLERKVIKIHAEKLPEQYRELMQGNKAERSRFCDHEFATDTNTRVFERQAMVDVHCLALSKLCAISAAKYF
jgi:hypothetical protein